MVYHPFWLLDIPYLYKITGIKLESQSTSIEERIPSDSEVSTYNTILNTVLLKVH